VSHPLVRPVIGAAAALTTALALTLGTATQAQAAESWPSANCATGQFTAVETSSDGQTALHGDVTQCAPQLGKPVFTLVVFYPNDFVAFAYSHLLVPYQPEGPTPFSGVFRSKPRAGQVGLCAMRTLTDRIACVRVTFPTDGPATMEPIPTTDPLVKKMVFYVDDDDQEPTPPPPSGFCGSCLELPTS
jgi:hypothetical protein